MGGTTSLCIELELGVRGFFGLGEVLRSIDWRSGVGLGVYTLSVPMSNDYVCLEKRYACEGSPSYFVYFRRMETAEEFSPP